MKEDRLKFGCVVDKYECGQWSFGINLSHDPWTHEFYIHISLCKISISIGKVRVYD